MTTLPSELPALLSIVFLLGLKHGLDPDHLVAIDGLARYNARRRPRLARFAGLLFSLGHGAVVTGVAILVAAFASDAWQAPAWLEHTGVWLSIGFLLVLGGANLAAVLRAPRGAVVRPVGVRARLFARLTETSHPVVMLSVGAAFALSFDTVSGAVLISLAGSKLAGWALAGLLGGVFTLGMVLTDALNGWWVSRLIGRADCHAAASRLMSVGIAALSLAIAALGLAKYVHPAFDEALQHAMPFLGAGVIAAVLALFVGAMHRARAPWLTRPGAGR